MKQDKWVYLIGFVGTLLFTVFSYQYYNAKLDTDALKDKNPLYEAVDAVDHKLLDFKFKIRDVKPVQAKIGLLAVDEMSVQTIGRWPWGRDVIAQIVDELAKYNAKATGFDAIFSEAQIADGNPDQKLADAIERHKDKVVLGVFSLEHEMIGLPYQDYCRNEAFKKYHGTEIVKINPTFIVEDKEDPFEDLEFDQLINASFGAIEPIYRDEIIKRELGKDPTTQLTPAEERFVGLKVEEKIYDYCAKWLTKEDILLNDPENSKQLIPAYEQLFSQNKLLKGKRFADAVEIFKKNSISHPIPQNGGWTPNIATVQEKADFTASFNALPDSDGTIRTLPLFFRNGNRIGLSFVPSLALQTYLLGNQYRAQIEIDKDPRDPTQKRISKFQIFDPSEEPEKLVTEIPVDGRGRMRINYYGPEMTAPYLPVRELLNGRDTATIFVREFDPQSKKWLQRAKEVNKAEFIKDRMFIFGATAMGIYDLRVTPFQENFPGPETHVQALANLAEANFLNSFKEEFKVIPWIMLGLGLIFTAIISSLGALTAFASFLLFNGAILGIDYWLFIQKKLVVTTVLPQFMLITIYFVLTMYKYFTEERKKAYLKSTFSKYVSPAIVDEILKNPDNLNLGGKKLRMSVSFSDVRGFTTISEKMSPEQLSDVLNRYLTPMTELVFSNKGTLDKYMGDAIMAFWGAPIEFNDHAAHTCRCALQSIEKLKEIQKEFAAEGLPMIDIGIGINTGEMSAGNMGSNIVRSYTVMGDSVNLASRLEGINKEYGTRIIISEFTYEDVKDTFTAREVDMVKVKGKNKPVHIFELICEGKPTGYWPEVLEHFNKGYQLYHAKQFQEAITEFELALKANPEDPVSQLYVERCTDYVAEPPPADWDGVYVMKTK